MALTPPTVTVLDLTARLGLHSLAQLGVSNLSGPGPWLQIPLADATVAPMVDWLRPATAQALSLPSPHSAAVVLIVAVQLQVRAVEEPYLIAAHGDAYLDYA